MENEEDYLMRPVEAQMCSYESLKNGTIDLLDIRRMHAMLDVKAENERRARKANE